MRYFFSDRKGREFLSGPTAAYFSYLPVATLKFFQQCRDYLHRYPVMHGPDYQVLLVCTANICRSPLAEALLRHRLQAMGLERRVRVCSAGTRVARRGRRPDIRLCRLAAEAGVPMGHIRSKPLTARLIAASDIVLVMEREHLDEVKQIYPHQIPDGLHLLGSYLADGSAEGVDIPDPYFATSQGCRQVFDLLDKALTGFSHQLLELLVKQRHTI